ncbi:MAG: amino acid ABC transporter permease, partial [Actinobacteria bacterium ATB1]|nr:amino acid ABC transporter permease [Actinobacteria bacterium ATB1]
MILAADWAKLQRVFLDPEIARESFPQVITVAAKNTLIFTILGFSGGL